MPRLLLIRHGQRARQPLPPAQSDPPLSDLGREQARRLGEHLATCLPVLQNPSASGIISSPMRRALETTVAMAAGLSRPGGLRCRGDLYEVGTWFPPDGNGPRTTPDLEASYGVTCEAINPAGWYPHARPESPAQVAARVAAITHWLTATLAGTPDELIAIVAHGDLIGRLLRRLLKIPDQAKAAFIHGHTGLTVLTTGPSGTLVEQLNALEHLPMRMRTGAEPWNWWSCVPGER